MIYHAREVKHTDREDYIHDTKMNSIYDDVHNRQEMYEAIATVGMCLSGC